MIDQHSELDTLAASGLTVEVAGERLDINPIRVRELPAFARALEPLAADLAAGTDMMALLARHADALIEAAAIGARRERAWLDGLTLDDLVRLAEAVLDVNLDFFVRRLMPAVTAAVERMGERLAGQNSTHDSAPPG